MDNTELENIQYDETPFLFRGEALALDLVNTEAMKRGKRRDLLETPQDVALWWQAACQHHPEWQDVQGGSGDDATIYDLGLLYALKTLRGALRGIFGTLVDGVPARKEDISILNGVLSAGRWSIDLTPEGELRPAYRIIDATIGPVLLSCALSALHLIREGDRKRIHHCESERCILFFYDTTRSATRRWCSTSCMERTRSIQRYRQAKQAALQ
jgi:predicted RNA-binding Zn ribbon-like protein